MEEFAGGMKDERWYAGQPDHPQGPQHRAQRTALPPSQAVTCRDQGEGEEKWEEKWETCNTCYNTMKMEMEGSYFLLSPAAPLEHIQILSTLFHNHKIIRCSNV